MKKLEPGWHVFSNFGKGEFDQSFVAKVYEDKRGFIAKLFNPLVQRVEDGSRRKCVWNGERLVDYEGLFVMAWPLYVNSFKNRSTARERLYNVRDV